MGQAASFGSQLPVKLMPDAWQVPAPLVLSLMGPVLLQLQWVCHWPGSSVFLACPQRAGPKGSAVGQGKGGPMGA